MIWKMVDRGLRNLHIESALKITYFSLQMVKRQMVKVFTIHYVLFTILGFILIILIVLLKFYT